MPPLTTDYIIADIFWIADEPLIPNDKIVILSGTLSTPGCIESISNIKDPANWDIKTFSENQLNQPNVTTVAIKLKKAICVDPFDKLQELGRFAVLKSGKITGVGILR